MSKKEKEMNLQKLKEAYEEYAKKHKLPSFTELNRYFDIEEITIETEFLLRKIRRAIAEKLAGYTRFIEVLINPSAMPPFLFKKIKKLDTHDKELLSTLYETLGDLETENFILDLNTDEEKEAHLIKKMYDMFNKSIKENLIDITKKLMNNEEIKNKNERGSYLG